MKKPWLAAVLNFIPGLGYLYLGIRKVFAWFLIAGSVSVLVACFDPTYQEYFNLGFSLFWVNLASILIGVAFILDAYYEAISMNAAVKKQKKA